VKYYNITQQDHQALLKAYALCALKNAKNLYDFGLLSMTFELNRVHAVVKVHVYAKYHQA